MTYSLRISYPSSRPQFGSPKVTGTPSAGRVPFGRRAVRCLIVPALAVVSMLAAPDASASPITYQLSLSATWSDVYAYSGEDSGSIAVSATFDIDSVTSAVSNVSGSLSGELDQLLSPAGSILVPGSLNEANLIAPNQLVIKGPAAGTAANETPDGLLLTFGSALVSAGGTDAVTGVLELADYNSSPTTFSGSATTQVPEPSSLLLLGGGLIALLFGGRNFRQKEFHA